MSIWRLFIVLRLSVRTWGFSALHMYVAITSPYPWDWGVTLVVSELRFTPGVGNHLGQYSGSYQQYNQLQIQACQYLNLGFQRRVQEYTVIDDSFLDSFLFLTDSYQLDYLIFFLLSFRLLASNPFSLSYFSIPRSLEIAECAAEVSWTRNISTLGLKILFSHLNWNFEDEIFCKVGRNVTLCSWCTYHSISTRYDV